VKFPLSQLLESLLCECINAPVHFVENCGQLLGVRLRLRIAARGLRPLALKLAKLSHRVVELVEGALLKWRGDAMRQKLQHLALKLDPQQIELIFIGNGPTMRDVRGERLHIRAGVSGCGRR
jgi:hypothetical protein